MVQIIDNTEKGDFPFKVNGVQFENPLQQLLASEILEIAKQKDAMPGPPGEYILQGEKRQYNPNEYVDLAQDNIFITIPNKATPVA